MNEYNQNEKRTISKYRIGKNRQKKLFLKRKTGLEKSYLKIKLEKIDYLQLAQNLKKIVNRVDRVIE